MNKFSDNKELLSEIKEMLEEFEPECLRGGKEIKKCSDLKENEEVPRYKSLKECIDKVYGDLNNGKKNKHQYRIPKECLKDSIKILKDNIEEINKCKSFDEIYFLIGGLHSNINKVGELASYDAALRIGAYKGLYPDKVYVHCGVKEGADSLKKLNLALDYRKVEYKGIEALILKKEDLSDVFKDIPYYKLEECFCVKKKEFKELEKKYTRN